MGKKIYVLFSLVFMLLFVLGLSKDTLAAEMGEVDTQVSLNVRAAPNEQATIIGSLPPGERIEFIHVGNGWGQMTYEGQLGFVSTSYLIKAPRTPDKQEDEPHQPEPESEQMDFSRIVIDAGHGGKDPGAVGNDLYEKTVALAISHKVKNRLEDEGYEVVMTREVDTFVSLENRALKSNEWPADLFVSIHANGYADAAANGIETFYYHGSAQGKQVARSIQHQLVEMTGNRSRGVFAADFYVLKHTNMPSVLVETGFVSNEKDATLLKTEEYQEKAAIAIVSGITQS
ncbi:N-acetylmuramoyl-L-alanine amidase [Alkalicoccobacillus murimartini]|uniref:N-acetylmuramoyl-L-alanine amidase n=1 Tax=Alkalicoccobacillus murimartini TaxID=171685 RepID=A0ABT9YIU2_9BACI|nr:N-acetylmuramoyl-L-alanine amidase [Alkalicoccobacillus murimartini]MDQ0207609.1 N-acetylmuramoyl-L-alanine amidase [Alkalicoccobacillus murimartini]